VNHTAPRPAGDPARRRLARAVRDPVVVILVHFFGR